jgi:hypothetical protein
MTRVCIGHLTGAREALRRILAHAFEHGVPRFAAEHLDVYQRLGDELATSPSRPDEHRTRGAFRTMCG